MCDWDFRVDRYKAVRTRTRFSISVTHLSSTFPMCSRILLTASACLTCIVLIDVVIVFNNSRSRNCLSRGFSLTSHRSSAMVSIELTLIVSKINLFSDSLNRASRSSSAPQVMQFPIFVLLCFYQMLELIFCGIPLLIVKVLGDREYQVPNEEETVTILLHGSGSNKHQHFLVRSWLTGPCYSFNYVLDDQGKECYFTVPPNRSIEEMVQVVRKQIKQLGFKKVNLIGTSMGGVVAMVYAERFAEEDKVDVRKIVTIGSPLQGTPFVGFLRKLTFGLLFNGRHLSEMYYCNYSESVLSSIKNRHKYLNVYGEHDIIVPPTFAVLLGASHHKVPGGHYSPMLNRPLWTHVNQWLNE